MYLFIHHKEPNDVLKLDEMISLAQFGVRAERLEIYANDRGDIAIGYPPRFGDDPSHYRQRILAGFQAAQDGLSNGNLTAIAQSPNNGRWVKVPTDYWIRHRTYEQALELGEGHEFEGAPIVVDLGHREDWARIIQAADAAVVGEEKPAKPQRVRPTDAKKKRLGLFFKNVVQDRHQRTQEQWHTSYEAWNRKQQRYLEPYGLSGFKKWFRQWFDNEVRW